jgi:hypothetical protein
MPRPSRIQCPDLDLERDGKQVSWLRLPHSSNTSAYGWIAIPIAVIRNGDGPTVLLTAGNHGDEYEGQVALTRLIRALRPEDVRGRLIIVTQLNQPAAQAGTRVSPIDGVNLNRCFPGDPDGTPTMAIADYTERVLLGMADYAIDLHSGGRTLLYVPSVLTHRSGDARIDAAARAMLDVFGAPVGYLMTTPLDDRTLLGAAARQGVPAIGTELGGAGTVHNHGLAVGERGVRNVLAHLGVLLGARAEGGPTARVVGVGGGDYAFAPDRGVFAYAVEVGDEVVAGDLLGELLFVDDPLRAPVPVTVPSTGILLCRRHPGPCERGDCLAQIGAPLG